MEVKCKTKNHSSWSLTHHGFIRKEYYLYSYEAFGKNQKQNYESLYSKWAISYESRDSVTLTRILKCQTTNCEPR